MRMGQYGPAMQRGLVHGAAWTLATGAAVTLSWWGVHTVMSGTAYDRPRALPIAGAADHSSPMPSPQSSSTHRPRETPEPGASDGDGTSDEGDSGGSGGTPSSSAPDSTPKPSGDGGGDSSASPSGNVKSYNVSGGRVAFEIGSDSAELVSATPNSGWQMQVWKQPTWIRVTFTQGDREVSVFCTWHDHKPMVEIDDRK